MNSEQQLTPPVDESDHRRGPQDAPVTLVEYGDYECPSCLMAYPIIKEVQEQMGDRLQFVFRNFPLKEAHPHAAHAAEIAEAAADQGKFWEMHDILYENQEALDDESLLEYAEAIGLDVERVMRALEGREYARRVREDFRSGVKSGVNGTPTFFINGERYDGVWTDVGEFVRAVSE